MLGGYNLIQNGGLPVDAYVPANLLVTGTMIGLALRSGCEWDDLGLSPSGLASGVRWGLAGAAGVTAAVGLAAGYRRTRPYFLDPRNYGHRGSEEAYRALVRYPLGTALFEEVAFRGILPALWRGSGARRLPSEIAGAVAFGVWHLLPIAQALAANPIGNRLDNPLSRWGVVASGAILTALASLGFSWQRTRSGSLAAPWLTHAALNTAAYAVGRAMWRRVGVR